MPDIPERGTLDERDIKRLVEAYAKAQREIIATFEDATDFGQARRRELLNQIDNILTEVGKTTGQWVEGQLPLAYERGSTDALKQLRSLNLGIKKTSTFSNIDRRAAALLASETQEFFAEGLTGVKRQAMRVLNQATREALQAELATSRILGETRLQTSARIKSLISQQGIVALIDRGGNQWTLERYAQMLARTKLTEARNFGLAQKMVQNGYDLVEVSHTSSKHQACIRWQGKILSLTGKTKGYQTLDQAKEAGLFHPNCKHQINVIHKDAAAITKAYDPTSGTYIKQFGDNVPKPPTGKIPTGNTLPKIPGKGRAITISGRGRTGNYVVNNKEAGFIERSRLTFSGGTAPGRRISKNTRGYYQPGTHNLHMRDPGDPHDQQTFYHELAHAIDYKSGRSKLTNSSEITKVLKADGLKVNAQRIINDLDGAITEAKAVEFLRGARISYERNGTKYTAKISTSHRRYMFRWEEIFADGYGQYRTNPAKFKKYAPNMFKLFEGLLND